MTRIGPVDLDRVAQDIGDEVERTAQEVEGGLRRLRMLPPPRDPDRVGRAGTPPQSRPFPANGRFDEPTLAKVAGGKARLKVGAEGEPVARVQAALGEIGFRVASQDELEKHVYGPETRRAVARFQREAGVGDDGVLGRDTLLALDRVAPPPGQTLRREPEYDRLYADGRLDVTIAVGFDEKDNARRTDAIVGELKDHGYRKIAVDKLRPDRRAHLGLDGPRGEGEIYYKRFWDPPTQSHKEAVVELVRPEGVDSREAFQRALGHTEVVFYNGHARYGTGPDFDDKKSGDANFVIDPKGNHLGGHQPPPELKAAIAGRESDLPKVDAAPGYQLLLFNACATENYLKTLRDPAKFPGRTPENTDILTTRIPTFLGTGGSHVMRFLDGLEHRESVNSMVEANNEIEGEYAEHIEKKDRFPGTEVTYVESGFLENSGNRWVKGD